MEQNKRNTEVWLTAGGRQQLTTETEQNTGSSVVVMDT